jgi:nitronate monooxygenase
MTIQHLFGIELPIIQAPMAGVQASALAVVVANAGGLGSLPCATLDPQALRHELLAIESQTSRPYNVNFFCHAQPVYSAEREAAWQTLLEPYYREFGIDSSAIPDGPGRLPFTSEAADVLEDFGPAVVSFHFGLPSPELLERVRSRGAKVISSATCVAEAQWLEAHGVDAVIAQGVEAGGHRGNFLAEGAVATFGTTELVRQIAAVVKIPVIAAGGIADAAGVSAAMAAGAAAVQVGTAYLLCPEATTSAVHRAALQSAAARTTALTNIFTGRAARGILNRVMRERGPMNDLAPEFPLATSAMAPLRAKAEAQGSGDFSPLWAGENAAGIREISAAVLTRELGAAGL